MYSTYDDYMVESPRTAPSLVPKDMEDKTIALLEDWFRAIENGTSDERMPDLTGKRFDEATVNLFIGMIDTYFEGQILYTEYFHRRGMETKGKIIDMPVSFNRLKGLSREAFMQQLKEVVK